MAVSGEVNYPSKSQGNSTRIFADVADLHGFFNVKSNYCFYPRRSVSIRPFPRSIAVIDFA
jgi:hypothetical protein